MKKSLETQRLVNSLPGWASGRSDEQSITFQFLNSVGLRMEDLAIQLANIGNNYYLSTANLDEIDLVYQFNIDPLFSFQVDNTDTSTVNYISPTVSGKIGNTWYPVAPSVNNDIESFWYLANPNRYNSTTSNSQPTIVLSGTLLSQTPTTSLNLPHLPGHLWVTIGSGTQFLSIENDQAIRGTVLIEGITRRGTEEEETLIFLYNDTRPTAKEWQQLTKVSVFGIEPRTTTTIGIRSERFANGPYVDFYNLEFSANRNKVDTFWDVGATVSGHSTLDLIRFTTDDFNNLLIGITDKEVVRSAELLNTSGINIHAVDLALVPSNQKVWVCTSGELFLYSLDQYYASESQLTKKQYDSIVKILPNSYHQILGNAVALDYSFVRPIKTLARHRVSMRKPSGLQYGIVNGGLVPITNDYWVYGQTTSRSLRFTENITLDQRGDFIFTLEAVMNDNTTYVDQVIVTTETKTPLVGLITPYKLNGISYDSDQKLWVRDISGIKYRIDLATDTMIVDYNQKIIYLKENYDDLKVIA